MSALARPVTRLAGNIVWAVALLFALALTVTVDIQPASCQCAQDSIHIDPSIANVGEDLFLGEAGGQTFYAPDTLLSSITVWRPPYRTTTGLRIFIANTATVQDTFHLAVSQPMLFDGPRVVAIDSNPPGGNVPVQFVFDPPLTLPGRGWYAFFVQTEGCSPGDYYLLEYQNHGDDPYVPGNECFTSRSVNGCVHVPPISANELDVDLCCSIVFCGDQISPTRRRSWGGLKILYR